MPAGAVAVVLAVVLVGCAAGGFAIGRALRSQAKPAVAAQPFTPPTLRLQAVGTLSQQPGLPALARR